MCANLSLEGIHETLWQEYIGVLDWVERIGRGRNATEAETAETRERVRASFVRQSLALWS